MKTFEQILNALFDFIQWTSCFFGSLLLAYIFIMAISGGIKITHVDDGNEDIIIRIH